MGSLLVVHESPLEERGLGTEPNGFGDGHPGMDSIATSGVRSRLDDPALISAATHYQELEVPQLRVIVPAHLDEEGVQVNVEKSGRHDWSLHQENSGCLERHDHPHTRMETHLV